MRRGWARGPAVARRFCLPPPPRSFSCFRAEKRAWEKGLEGEEGENKL